MSEKEHVILGGQIIKVTTTQDRSIKITFETQEVTLEQAAYMLTLNQDFGFLLFSKAPFNENNLPEIPEEIELPGGKSKAQRLRGVLFRLWKEKYEKQYPEFDIYYKHELEKIIDHFKKYLNKNDE